MGFTVESAGLENSLLKFKLLFDSPLLISMGAINDKMIATIVDGSFFSSSENGLPLKSGTNIEQPLPKMFPDEDFAEAMETTETAVSNAANTFVIVQLILTVALALSLKSMWNLMNVVQVLAYVRFFTGWPAQMLGIFEYMDNAITLKPVTNLVFDYGKNQFEKANATLTDEGMQGMGVQDSNMWKGLGFFAFAILAILLLVIIYQFFKCSKKKTGLSYKIKLML